MILHHLGIACTDIRETLEQVGHIFPIIGHSAIVHDPEQNADLCLVFLRDSPPLELISGAMVEKLPRKGILLYHSCWEVENIEKTMAYLCATANCLIISGPKPAILFGSRTVAFLASPVGLVELLTARRGHRHTSQQRPGLGARPLKGCRSWAKRAPIGERGVRASRFQR